MSIANVEFLPNYFMRWTMSGAEAYDRVQELKRKKGIKSDREVERMTFHQLRHMNASVMSMLNIPEKYAQERGGWKTPHTMERVYQHTFSRERVAVDETIDGFFENMIGGGK